jgi:hypothetical protein
MPRTTRTTTPAEPEQVEQAAASNGDVENVALGSVMDMPTGNGGGPQTSKIGERLNEAARTQHEHPGQGVAIVVAKSPRVATGRASAIRRQLASENGVRGLTFPADKFKIAARGSAVLALFTGDGPVEEAAEQPDEA